MTPKIRKLVLTAHIALSVGWLGAVTGFLVLSIASLTSQNTEIVRGAYVSMNLIGLYAIVPLGFAALLTGLVQSLGTSWGLFRQYWTVIKFGLTVGAVFVLLVHRFEAIGRLSRLVLSLPPGVLPTFGSLETELLVKAGLAIVVLLVTTVLSVYKPWGRESADVILIGSDLPKLVETLRVARRCRGIIMQTFAGTLVADSIGIGMAAFGLLNPLLAAFIHVASELTFILNSTRLLPRSS